MYLVKTSDPSFHLLMSIIPNNKKLYQYKIHLDPATVFAGAFNNNKNDIVIIGSSDTYPGTTGLPGTTFGYIKNFYNANVCET